MLLYLASIGLAFMSLVVHLSPSLTLLELACAAVPVGSIGGAWIFFLGTMLLNFLGYAELLWRRAHRRDRLHPRLAHRFFVFELLVFAFRFLRAAQ